MDSDERLLWHMRKGDDAAIELFVRKYYPPVFQYCRRRAKDIYMAEDLTQETFERFFRNFSEYEHRGKTINYLYTIAGNLCRDFYKAGSGIELPAEDVNMLLAEISARQREDDGKLFYNPISSLAEQMDLENAISRLPEVYRESIVLYFFCGMKQKEIAEALNVKLRVVKYRIRKGRELLKKMLEEERLYDGAGTEGSTYQKND
ncbi:Sigma-70 region 2 [Marvinbryantia formatexigens DSM 14469]|uniref:Sigma-70 region 2 n=1 Tax=Marvinbryantia formatexigens DSM 14469 TaxID=478749 RepID=C6LAD5_9FIRM|nr:sigma-70 family RNA polymerase sigma factor [Marvinbryantia formatexigens]EET62542.1 Sigma-70 region 2 [Marvinbryantia formatexigens DSM 14469]UWO24937.1 sigma-70 family RNA polymerase sigma factor [Marvinbryantia formatexigens DSM 14469]SDG24469.1 RNA polymerase sigma-70 factor, ECF subfamily [Marvinbryantia formatexigens]